MNPHAIEPHTLHRVWRLGTNVDTDALAPGHAMKHGMDVIARHCLEALRPDFAKVLDSQLDTLNYMSKSFV